MQLDLGMTLAVIGGLVGLLGLLAGRDRSISKDAEWRGGVNAKLDVIVGIRQSVDALQKEVTEHTGRIAATEASVKQAHRRMDEHIL